MSTNLAIDTEPITGPRKSPFNPVPFGLTGYHSDSGVQGGGYVWWAVDGRLHLVSEKRVTQAAQRLADIDTSGTTPSEYQDLILAGLEEDIDKEQPPVFTSEEWEQIRQIQGHSMNLNSIDESGPIEAYEPDDDEFPQPEPKNLAEAIKMGYSAFEAALRNPLVGHKHVANMYPFTSETSVRRWRKSHGIEVAR